MAGMGNQGQDFYLRGFLLSAVGHIALLFGMFANLGGGIKSPDPIVYSVSIEGGKSLGGIAQVSRVKKKEHVAPPKKIKQEVVQSKPKEVAKDAEVSLKQKPTPKPTVKPTAKPKPKKKSTPVSTPKPKVQPKSKPKPKPKPRKKEPTLDEINKKLQAAVQRYAGESSDAGGKGFGAAKLGGQGMGGGVVRPPAFFRYLKTLERYIKGGWRWHDSQMDVEARVCFSISPQGDLAQIKICGSSGNSEYDDSALRAVYKANPVPAPPAEVYEYFKEVRMTFSAQE